jgi:hypothetical protein
VEGGGVGDGVGELGGPVAQGYSDGPGQVRRLPEELLVEVVAPTSYGLAQDAPRGGRVGERQRSDSPEAGEDEKT